MQIQPHSIIPSDVFTFRTLPIVAIAAKISKKKQIQIHFMLEWKLYRTSNSSKIYGNELESAVREWIHLSDQPNLLGEKKIQIWLSDVFSAKLNWYNLMNGFYHAYKINANRRAKCIGIRSVSGLVKLFEINRFCGVGQGTISPTFRCSSYKPRIFTKFHKSLSTLKALSP